MRKLFIIIIFFAFVFDSYAKESQCICMQHFGSVDKPWNSLIISNDRELAKQYVDTSDFFDTFYKKQIVLDDDGFQMVNDLFINNETNKANDRKKDDPFTTFFVRNCDSENGYMLNKEEATAFLEKIIRIIRLKVKDSSTSELYIKQINSILFRLNGWE